MNPDLSVFEAILVPDHLASDKAIRSESTMFSTQPVTEMLHVNRIKTGEACSTGFIQAGLSKIQGLFKDF